MTDVDNHIQNIFLAFHRSNGVDFVESILLQDNEVNQFRFPESNMVFYRYTVVTEDINLFGDFLTTLQTSFEFIYLANPFTVDMPLDIFLKFRYSIYLE